jgi:hypothetical protein
MEHRGEKGELIAWCAYPGSVFNSIFEQRGEAQMNYYFCASC